MLLEDAKQRLVCVQINVYDLCPTVIVNNIIRADRFWYALCEGLIGPEYLELVGSQQKSSTLGKVVGFVIDELSSLPIQLRVGLIFGISAFKMYVFLFTRQPLYKLPILQRKQLIEHWASGRFSLTRKLFRPLRSLTVLAFFEQPEVEASLNRQLYETSNH